MKVILLAGGSGTRFWPKSVKEIPKQFLALTSDRTMLQETYSRFLDWLPLRNLYVATIGPYAGIVREQLPELSDEQLIIEPLPRDTGPCIALAAARFLAFGDDEALVTMPSDHYISDVDELRRVLELAESQASEPRSIVTLGVRPTRPETGYGYIETEAADDTARDSVRRVLRFLEKPSEDLAKRLIEEPNVYWNSGIFIWKPSTIAYYMQRHQPAIWSVLTDSGTNLEARYGNLPKISVDYAILEKAEAIHCIPVRFRWDDVGRWTAMERIYPVDGNGNLLRGDVHVLNTTDTTVFSELKRTIVIGLDHFIVVNTEHGILICSKSDDQMVKTVLEQLESDSRQRSGPTEEEAP